MRGLLGFGIMVVSLAMVGAGLFMTFAPTGEGVVLAQPGTPGHLEGNTSSATAFFEVDGDALELTMLFDEPTDPANIFRTRVRLIDGQSHSIILGGADDGTDGQRYTFRRNGAKIEMSLEPAEPLIASFGATE